MATQRPVTDASQVPETDEEHEEHARQGGGRPAAEPVDQSPIAAEAPRTGVPA